MVGRQGTILIFVGAMSLCGVVRADLVPLSPPDAGSRPSSQTGLPAESQVPSLSSSYADLAGLADLDPLPVGLVLPPQAGAGQPRETQPAQILADRQDSLGLCLYALLGLGLYRSAPLVKKFHLGGIPDWYYTGDPYQIGDSFAISPDCHSSVPVYCFVQPDSRATIQYLLPQHRRRTLMSLWRKSLFTPALVGSRGPPCLS